MLGFCWSDVYSVKNSSLKYVSNFEMTSTAGNSFPFFAFTVNDVYKFCSTDKIDYLLKVQATNSSQ